LKEKLITKYTAADFILYCTTLVGIGSSKCRDDSLSRSSILSALTSSQILEHSSCKHISRYQEDVEYGVFVHVNNCSAKGLGKQTYCSQKFPSPFQEFSELDFNSFGEGDARTYSVRCQVMLPGVSGLVPLDGPCLKFNGF